jgi:hypothetical protein
MGTYVWSHLERRDLYLASRLLADAERDGDWVQWASDTLIYVLEIYNDPREGVGFWLFEDEVQFVDELGERLWGVVKADPYNAAALVGQDDGSLRATASKLVERMKANGRSREVQ